MHVRAGCGWNCAEGDQTAHINEGGRGRAWQGTGQGGEFRLEQILAGVARSGGRTPRQNDEFEQALHEGLLPGGRILANAGTFVTPATLANCFLHPMKTSGPGLLRTLRRVRRTLRSGGGVGVDLQSSPDSSNLKSVLIALESLARHVESAGGRPAALMGSLPIEHPAAPEFMRLKQHHALPHFNFSLTVTDEFMRRLGRDTAADHRWRLLADHALASGDPGVLFIDTIRSKDNLGLQERIESCNPCAEQPLAEGGDLVLGSIALPRLEPDPLKPSARYDTE